MSIIIALLSAVIFLYFFGDTSSKNRSKELQYYIDNDFTEDD